MPIHSSVDSENGLIHSTYQGTFDPEELLAYYKEVWGTEQQAPYNELFDARGLAIADTPFTSLLLIAKSSTKTFYDNPETKKAILVENDEQKNFFDFYQSARSLLSVPTSTIKVFRDVNEARTWLGLS